mmetsp:Transcript_7328/g.13376  ORF Transcript_7328/g.13376 Transcript_7328/m.13376 type:complete len:80 (+) Transcript_7328:57-296(+)
MGGGLQSVAETDERHGSPPTPASNRRPFDLDVDEDEYCNISSMHGRSPRPRTDLRTALSAMSLINANPHPRECVGRHGT